MLDETRTRFLAAIAKQIPAERVAEVHLFSAIRQGGMESGVAVIAAEREAVERESAATLDVDGGDPAEPGVASVAELDAADEIVVNDQLEDETAFVADETAFVTDVTLPEDEPGVVAAAEVPPKSRASRFIVYSARYRHTLKGPDRGKWEVAVTEEADAPLLTVDAVVRGVQRRSGDADETVRLSGDEFRASLPQPAT